MKGGMFEMDGGDAVVKPVPGDIQMAVVFFPALR
jgi:hypothetical protein